MVLQPGHCTLVAQSASLGAPRRCRAIEGSLASGRADLIFSLSCAAFHHCSDFQPARPRVGRSSSGRRLNRTAASPAVLSPMDPYYRIHTNTSVLACLPGLRLPCFRRGRRSASRGAAWGLVPAADSRTGPLRHSSCSAVAPFSPSAASSTSSTSTSTPTCFRPSPEVRLPLRWQTSNPGRLRGPLSTPLSKLPCRPPAPA